MFGPKKIWSEKKKFEKRFCPKTCLSKNLSLSEKNIFGLKFFLGPTKNFGLKNILCPKKII